MKKTLLSLCLFLSATSALRAESNDSIGICNKVIDKVAFEPDEKEIPARVYFEDVKLHFASRDNKFKLWFDNRIYVDAAYYSPSADVDGLLFFATVSVA